MLNQITMYTYDNRHYHLEESDDPIDGTGLEVIQDDTGEAICFLGKEDHDKMCRTGYDPTDWEQVWRYVIERRAEIFEYRVV